VRPNPVEEEDHIFLILVGKLESQRQCLIINNAPSYYRQAKQLQDVRQLTLNADLEEH
jgi:hypothetical protein